MFLGASQRDRSHSRTVGGAKEVPKLGCSIRREEHLLVQCEVWEIQLVWENLGCHAHRWTLIAWHFHKGGSEDGEDKGHDFPPGQLSLGLP